MTCVLIIHSNHKDAVNADVATVCEQPGLLIRHVSVDRLAEKIAGLQYGAFVEMPGVRLTYEERARVFACCRWTKHA